MRIRFKFRVCGTISFFLATCALVNAQENQTTRLFSYKLEPEHLACLKSAFSARPNSLSPLSIISLENCPPDAVFHPFELDLDVESSILSPVPETNGTLDQSIILSETLFDCYAQVISSTEEDGGVVELDFTACH